MASWSEIFVVNIRNDPRLYPNDPIRLVTEVFSDKYSDYYKEIPGLRVMEIVSGSMPAFVTLSWLFNM